MALKELLSSKISNAYFIEVDKIKIEKGFNSRKDFGDIPSLALDIAANGLTQPLIVRIAPDKNSVVLTDGERRLRAIKYLNEKHLAKEGDMLEVKCILEDPGTNEETRLIKVFSTGANSKPLTEMEQADVIYRLLSYVKSKEEIAKRIGRTVLVVSHLLELRAAPFEVREAVKDKKISPTAARVLSKASKEMQQKVLATAKPGKIIKVRDVERTVKGVSTQISSKSIKDKIKRIEVLLKSKKVSKEYHDIIKGLKLALGYWELP